jgi:hypothetical protein
MPGNFAVRLRCPLCDLESWVALPAREETYDQISQQTWELKCRNHGPQRSSPREVIELASLNETPASETPEALPAIRHALPTEDTRKLPRSSERIAMRVPVVVFGFTKNTGAFHEDTETRMVNSSGALVMLRTRLQIGDSVFLMHQGSGREQEVRVVYLDPYTERETKVGLAFRKPISNFWRGSRKESRVPKTLRVVVKGTDPHGHRFKQSSCTIDLSHGGARLDGIGFLTSPGQIIEVRRLWRKKKFRVVWIGEAGTSQANQVGVSGLQGDDDIWRVTIPEGQPDDAPAKPKPRKK